MQQRRMCRQAYRQPGFLQAEWDAEIIEDGKEQHEDPVKPQRHMDGQKQGIFLCLDCTKAAKEEKEQPCPEAERLGNILLYTVTPVHG